MIAEKLWPAYEVRRKKELRIDLLSLAALFASSQISRLVIKSWSGTDLLTGFSHQIYFIELWPVAVRIVAAILCADFLLYWLHRALHHPRLWRIHVWHHSVTELYWFSGFRASCLHTFLYLVPQLLLAYTVFHLRFWENVIVFSIGAFAQIWAHTSVKGSHPWIEWIILTPKYHRLHHARDIHGKNYGAFLTVWDRLFKTYHSVKDLPDDFAVGLGAEPLSSAQRARMIVGL